MLAARMVFEQVSTLSFSLHASRYSLMPHVFSNIHGPHVFHAVPEPLLPASGLDFNVQSVSASTYILILENSILQVSLLIGILRRGF